MQLYFKESSSCHTTAPTDQPLAEIFSVSDFARRKLKFDPDPIQTAILDSQSSRGILNCTRQFGKSSVTAAKAVHRAYTRPESLILVASPSHRQSAEFLRKAEGFVCRLGVDFRRGGQNACAIELPNGSRIVGVPGKEGTVRGYSAVSLMLIDEASRVSDEMYQALRPMLAVSGGDLWIMSTPYGRRGFFYDIWTNPDGWQRFTATAADCPRIPAAFLEQERQTMTAAWFAQEYMCEFGSDNSCLFPRELLDAALSDYEPLNLD